MTVQELITWLTKEYAPDTPITADIWLVEDVLSVDDSLTHTQAVAVLEAVADCDANEGINWTTIEVAIANVK